MSTKHCPACGEVKPLGDFHRDCTRPTGRHPHCKECVCARVRHWYASLDGRQYNRRLLGTRRVKALRRIEQRKNKEV